MVGRPRIPRAIKAAKGTLREDRENQNAPTSPVGAPRAPRGLPEAVRREYDAIARILTRSRVLTIDDGRSLELLAFAVVEQRAHSKILESEGYTYTTTTDMGSTMVRARPEAALMADAWRRAFAGLQHFGLTPASRGKVEAKPPEAKEDPVAQFKAERGQLAALPGRRA